MMSAPSGARKGLRDPRLDFFRGLGMFIILFAHIPGNAWADWIPARFGFADATEIFVFCSGVASAIAFGRVFDLTGWRLGAARILHRVWQVYWAHIGVFITVVAALAAADEALGGRYLRHDLNLGPFLDAPGRMLLGFVTLTYVPNYFDILPMYLVILGLIPLVMAAERAGRGAVALLVGLLWLLAYLRLLDLPAEPWSQRIWFFNPFSWQLIFFLGFAFGRGWLIPPGFDKRLLVAALAVLALAAPFSCQYGWSCFAGWGALPWLGEMHQALFPLIDKTHLAPLRIVHFLALAYLAYTLAGDAGKRLRGAFSDAVQQVGRQTLAVFLAGLVLAQLLGVALDVVGRSMISVTLANLGGAAVLMLVAAICDWFKGSPWSKSRERRKPEEAPEPASVPRTMAAPRLAS
jgi:hypothetical protein